MDLERKGLLMQDNDKTEFVNDEKDDSNKKLEKIYAELGKVYYEGKFEDPLPELLPFFDEITKLKNLVKAPQKCPQCGNILKKEAVFCGKCGYKVR